LYETWLGLRSASVLNLETYILCWSGYLRLCSCIRAEVSGGATVAEVPAFVEIQRAALLRNHQIPELTILAVGPLSARFGRVNNKSRGIKHERLRCGMKILRDQSCLFLVLREQLRYGVFPECGPEVPGRSYIVL
jgi:hypothetical protein